MNKIFVFFVLITTQLKNGQCQNLIPNADFESCNFLEPPTSHLRKMAPDCLKYRIGKIRRAIRC
jgi:hypothetical protein